MTTGHGIALDCEQQMFFSKLERKSRKVDTTHHAQHPFWSCVVLHTRIRFPSSEGRHPAHPFPSVPHLSYSLPRTIVSTGFKIASTKISKTAKGRAEKGSSAPRARTSTTPWWSRCGGTPTTGSAGCTRSHGTLRCFAVVLFIPHTSRVGIALSVARVWEGLPVCMLFTHVCSYLCTSVVVVPELTMPHTRM